MTEKTNKQTNKQTNLQTDEEKPKEQTNEKMEWLDNELEEVNKQSNFDGERLPSLQFEENVIVKFSVDFSEPFKEYHNPETKVLKAIIPVVQNNERKILWLNKKNPLYRELLSLGKEGKTEFAVMQVGSRANTKYKLVKEENL